MTTCLSKCYTRKRKEKSPSVDGLCAGRLSLEIKNVPQKIAGLLHPFRNTIWKGKRCEDVDAVNTRAINAAACGME